MKSEEILKKAIEKAKSNGWDKDQQLFNTDLLFRMGDEVTKLSIKLLIGDFGSSYFSLIFRHDFAKAFWGSKEELAGWPDAQDGNYPMQAWQKHLMLMVLEEDPIKYLEEYL